MRLIAMMLLMCVGVAAGCATEPTDAAGSSALRANEPTPEMIAAALAGDPDWMARVAPVLDAACHAATSCPGYNCEGVAWSTPVSCGAPQCGGAGTCHFIWDPGPPKPRAIAYPATSRPTESYRVCWNAAQQGCTEWRQQAVSLGCDEATCCPQCALL